MTLGSNDPADTSSTEITLTVSLVNYPHITTDKTFQAEIICQLFSLDWDIEVNIENEYMINLDTVLELPFSVIQTPACGKPLTLSTSPDLASVPWISVDHTQENFVIQTTDYTNSGHYYFNYTL